MKEIQCNDRIIYRAGRGKKVKFINDKSTYVEIVVKKDDKREIVEVDE